MAKSKSRYYILLGEGEKRCLPLRGEKYYFFNNQEEKKFNYNPI